MHTPPPSVPAAALAGLRDLFQPLPGGLEATFDTQLDAGIARLLPVLGPAFGLFVVLFGAWDAWIDAVRAPATARIRVALVLLGAPAWAAGRLRWSPRARCAWLYATHTGAMVVCAAMLPDGLVLALPGLTGALFLLAMVEPRPRRFMLATLPPSLMLVLLAGLNLPTDPRLHVLLLYTLSWPLALCVALATLQLRRRAFLAEQAVLDAVRHDSLSGALSRRYVTELAQHDLVLARRYGRPLALAMLDIDHFKRVNDTWGHATGDRALCALVATCRENLRASDYIGRLGGEEFVCLMPETDAGEAMACAERMRAAVAALRIPVGADTLRFTVSAGVAVLSTEHSGWEDLLRAADAALYEAKESGRNRTVLARTPAPSARAG